MTKTRLEAFSDGVIAIIITIMVLGLRPPEGATLAALSPVAPFFLTYVLSFVMLGIYWNNHHHMMQLADRITGGILWANLHLLFWLTLVPFVTSWMGENHSAPVPVAVFGVVSLLAAISYYILQHTIVNAQGPDSRLARAIGRDLKGKASPLLYTTGIGLAFVLPELAISIYALVGLMWLVPDRRVEGHLQREEASAAR
jgi:uncharacterized membrane protein